MLDKSEWLAGKATFRSQPATGGVLPENLQ
jgi:hypothetical protein